MLMFKMRQSNDIEKLKIIEKAKQVQETIFDRTLVEQAPM